MSDEQKMKASKVIFNLLMFIIGGSILFLLLDSKCHGEKTVSTKDTIIMLATKPEVHNYNFTNPTVYKESTIEYKIGYVLTKIDSDLIVVDYLKKREYRDSIVNDTSGIWYHATVEKNTLANIDFRHSYKPKIYSITETVIKEPNRILIGLAPGWVNEFPSIAFYASYDAKRFNVGVMYDAIKNPKGGYLIISKPINFKR